MAAPQSNQQSTFDARYLLQEHERRQQQDSATTIQDLADTVRHLRLSDPHQFLLDQAQWGEPALGQRSLDLFSTLDFPSLTTLELVQVTDEVHQQLLESFADKTRSNLPWYRKLLEKMHIRLSRHAYLLHVFPTRTPPRVPDEGSATAAAEASARVKLSNMARIEILRWSLQTHPFNVLANFPDLEDFQLQAFTLTPKVSSTRPHWRNLKRVEVFEADDHPHHTHTYRWLDDVLKVLGRCAKLEHLSISMPVSPQQLARLAPLRIIHVGSRLRHLDLQPRPGVLPLLSRYFPSLTSLRLICALGPMCEEGLPHLRSLRHLARLDVNFNTENFPNQQFSPEGFGEMLNGMEKLDSLTVSNLNAFVPFDILLAIAKHSKRLPTADLNIAVVLPTVADVPETWGDAPPQLKRLVINRVVGDRAGDGSFVDVEHELASEIIKTLFPSLRRLAIGGAFERVWDGADNGSEN